MKILMLIVLSVLLMACSQKSDVLGVESEGEYYALDHAAKEAIVNEDDDEQLVCRRTQKTGSHFKVKKCTTKSQLAKEQKEAKEIIDSNSIQNTRRMVDDRKDNK
jgi:major membrane immunogen (membrane-anchored lipoprotein)